MENYTSYFTLVLLLLLLLNSTKPFSAATTTTDQHALLEFKNSIDSDPNNILARNWSSSTSVCYWIGVSCGNKHQRVTGLNVSGFGLSGTLPPHLGNLTFLRYLDVSFNGFTSPIPSELSRLHRLREVNMGVNSFAGEIPSWLGALPRLEKLRLRNNTFSGRIPLSLFTNNSKLELINFRFNSLSGSIPEEIGRCSSLQIVYMEENRLTGPIPHGVFNLSSLREVWIMNNGISGGLPSDMCNNLPNLTTLVLSGNQIESRIPQNIWKCRELEVLDLSFNRFSGEIPRETGSLSMLKELYLGYNDFKGGVPEEMGNLSRLEIVGISEASLTGSIPKQLGNCTSLTILELVGNHLTGELPRDFGYLPFLEVLNVHNNSLSGSIPSSIFNVSTLTMLDLSWNNFSGNLRIPVNISLSNLERLYLVFNELGGEIPSSITSASKLTVLDLSENSFSCFVPDFGSLRLLRTLDFVNNDLSGTQSSNQESKFLTSLTNCRYLNYLGISGNPLAGVLPTSIGNLSTSLKYFHAEGCHMKGVIPPGIGNLSSLLYLFLARNQMTGVIPPTIGALKQLQILSLSGNRLQGHITPDLCRLSNMGELYLNDNVFTGSIPICLGEVKSLRSINLGSNKLNSTVPSAFWNLKDLLFLNLSSNYLSGQLLSEVANLKIINKLDLSHNQFSGDIPSSIAGCQTLGFLDLSNNMFQGYIPPSIGNIRGLNTLNLSDNNLSGTIPGSFEGLNLLQYLNVSCNMLEGEIPSRGPFVNFTAQSFFNNSALCGETKFQVVPCDEKNRTSRLKKVGQLMMYILPPFISVIILATIIVFVLMRRRKLKSVPSPAHTFSPSVHWRRFSYAELARGSNAFSEANLLGRGSFGSVFKATLSDGLNVAVKVFNLQVEGGIRNFDTESKILSNLRHRNLVRVIGCCSNIEFKALILGYMPNGSLERWLYSNDCFLDLAQRLQIAIDVALALEYLHHGHTFPVVHCDVKPSNVLLDEDMVAHLADFGISKLFDDGETMVQTKTLTTIGYAAPEYGSEGIVSTNGDVYSYGILLLEMFTRKRPTDDMFSDKMSLEEWVHRAVQTNAVVEVVTPHILAREEDDQHFLAKEECVSSIFSLAMKCLSFSPAERINMIETVGVLQRIKAKVVKIMTTIRRHQHAPPLVAKGLICMETGLLPHNSQLCYSLDLDV